MTRGSLCRVINASGVVIHTNLGRALVGNAELLGVLWLRARTRRPNTVREEGPTA